MKTKPAPSASSPLRPLDDAELTSVAGGSKSRSGKPTTKYLVVTMETVFVGS